MSQQISFNVEVRERTGKGGAREARRNGQVPGVLYGGGQDPVAITLKLNEVIKAINTGHFLTSTANLVHDGKKQLVIPQAIQMHPVTDQPMHVDLYRVNESQIISVEVAVHFLNEDKAPGL
ncbi:MAG: 50S ribosomal protein L25, partial [Henriciella sp.]